MLNIIGLILDFIGALLVFFNSPEFSYTSYGYLAEEWDALQKKERKIRKRAKIGFILIALGFLLQLCSNFFK